MTEPDVVLAIEDMMCQDNCARTVRNCIMKFPLVKEAIVTHATGLAEIWLHGDKSQDIHAVLDALERIGYGAALKADYREGADNPAPTDGAADVTLFIEKMNRKGDFAIIQETLSAVDGVTQLDFEFSDKLAYVWGFADANSLVAALASKNYVAVDNAHRSTVATPAADSVAKTCETPVVAPPKLQPARHALADATAPVVSKREFVYSIRGMSCSACSAKIERMLKTLPGVLTASVSVMTHQGLVTVDSSPDAIGPRDIIQKVEDLGYGCKLVSGEGSAAGMSATMESNEDDLRQWRYMLIASLILGVPVVILHSVGSFIPGLMMYLMQPDYCSGGVNNGQVWMLVLNFLMLLIVGQKYYRAALMGASHGSLGMDFLVMVGTSITFIYSMWELYLACDAQQVTEHVFFETTGMLLLFVTIGKYIEAYAKGRSASAMAELLKLQPSEALLVSGRSAELIQDPNETNPLIHDEDVQSIQLDLIQKGDIVKVLPGDRIPTDGYLVRGSTYVDESMITGESHPVHKEKGDLLFGSTVNQDACVYMSVTNYGSESALAQIVRLVENAQLNKAPVQDYADRVASIFTPTILVLAGLTFITWMSLCESDIIPRKWFEETYGDPMLFSLLFAISVVVISCPCALGLATPTAIMVGTIVGAHNGILIKGGSAFEVAHMVDTVVFDKTGTLTEGKPHVTDVILVNTGSLSPAAQAPGDGKSDNAKRELILLAATAEQCSEHPIAQAILRYAQEKYQMQPLPLHENASVTFVGSGVSCSTSMGVITVGNRQFMRSKQISVSAAADTSMWNLEIQGKTAVCVALNEEVVGILGIADILKRESEDIIKALRAAKVDVWMITGDNATTAEALANKLELPQDRVLAGVLPQDKSAKVKALQEAGHVVAMVGDGINDSPALVQANLGVAIGAGTQIAIESASMVLIRSNLHDLVVALDLAKVVFARIRWNFLWALFYNVIAIPFAAGVWFPWTKMALPPHYAGLAMAASSISVVLSSMLLNLYQRPHFHGDLYNEQRNLSFCAWLGLFFVGSNHIRGDQMTPVAAISGYDQLPLTEEDAEQYLGIELGLGGAQRSSGATSTYDDHDDVL